MTTESKQWESFNPLEEGFVRTGKIVEHLKQKRNSHRSSDMLKMYVTMSASLSAQFVKQEGHTLSGPGAFLISYRGDIHPLHRSCVQVEGSVG